MVYAELIEEAKDLSESNMSEVIDFIKFLKSRQEQPVHERKSNTLKGKLKYMADDFDETPNCFKEYM
ncbi:DUF2281 domain-containing protein [Oribacterium sp. FC2011]|uniref:DUF2281 domain-containing protein n=1 Tax=Oribacterium sp. FC2011 TaxID=1408311 RepID=UPI0004E16936|nr:DUF2281 domain-containing protein [Oribacterium sp. FC2011]